MADEADQAQARNERELELLLGARRRSDQPRPMGFCHYCSETIAAGLPFCSPECRDDWQRERRLRSRQGRGASDEDGSGL